MKVRITETQLKRLKTLIKEENNDSYSREVTVSFYAHGATFKGNEINDIGGVVMRLNYFINMEVRSWGIKDISLYNVRGPEETEIEVDYYYNGDDSRTETVKIKLNWDAVTLDSEDGNGMVSIADDVDVELVEDGNGGLMVKNINVTVYK